MNSKFIKKLAKELGQPVEEVKDAYIAATADMVASKMFMTISETTKDELEERERWKEERCERPMEDFISISININL